MALQVLFWAIYLGMVLAVVALGFRARRNSRRRRRLAVLELQRRLKGSDPSK
ncbi:MAG TPA: hypothetical protein VNF75_03560 [Candidatus Dormibacteraeota bacterium]|nr:hypothetical protein [Candidatus Dormibacteraeota bacterium]